MKDGAILANTGHFNVEIEIPALRDMAVETKKAREFVEEFTLADGRRLYLIADGRLVNLSAAEGHPALVMDMSFANQALALEYAAQHASELDRKVYPVPAGDRPRDRPPQARDDGRRDRHAHGGAGALPRLVGRGDLSRSETSGIAPSRSVRSRWRQGRRASAGRRQSGSDTSMAVRIAR